MCSLLAIFSQQGDESKRTKKERMVKIYMYTYLPTGLSIPTVIVPAYKPASTSNFKKHAQTILHLFPFLTKKNGCGCAVN